MLEDEDRQQTTQDRPPEAGEQSGSLMEDVMSLLDDGVTYAEAEVAYQKSRLAYAGDRAKKVAILGGLAIVLVIFALFGLVFGAILALTPLLTAIGATALVVAILLVVALLSAIYAKAKVRELTQVFKAPEE